LAREAAAEDIDVGQVGAPDVTDVGEAVRVGPVLGQDKATEGIELDLVNDVANPCGFQPKLKKSNAGEQRADPEPGAAARISSRVTCRLHETS
jgi:hypothetical protein